mmetsp:Transcript_2812/g.5205  ORF Transcript_2812/g.5205 Transcript_2812/m.5205 type:complete len:285 (-) Transcript_2812:576-1430(-)
MREKEIRGIKYPKTVCEYLAQDPGTGLCPSCALDCVGAFVGGLGKKKRGNSSLGSLLPAWLARILATKVISQIHGEQPGLSTCSTCIQEELLAVLSVVVKSVLLLDFVGKLALFIACITAAMSFLLVFLKPFCNITLTFFHIGCHIVSSKRSQIVVTRYLELFEQEATFTAFLELGWLVIQLPRIILNWVVLHFLISSRRGESRALDWIRDLRLLSRQWSRDGCLQVSFRDLHALLDLLRCLGCLGRYLHCGGRLPGRLGCLPRRVRRGFDPGAWSAGCPVRSM